ncbi:hypothetical protein LCGC14_0538700 [marine sediment metagenome]|uniref:Uncharacterized protein n=1 Tax=marine sediment metagenome TaxID=412755 RepID=A0A0F9RTM1_9ZZZZ
MKLNYNRNSKKIVRPKKPVARPVAFADTNMMLNGCKVMVAHPNAELAQKVAVEFRDILAYNINRARIPNLQDMWRKHFELCEKVASGEKVFEEKFD